jgi:peptidoglycan/LPS O-acetylase OafA/YrhL
LVVFGLYIGAQIIFPTYIDRLPTSPQTLIWFVAANLLMLPGVVPMRPMITVAWSLSYELFFYIFICLVVTTFRMRQWQPRWRISLFAGIALVRLLSADTPLAFHSRMTMFLAGILLWEVTNSLRWVPSHSGFVEVAVAILFVGVLLTIGESGSGRATEMALTTFPGFRLPLLFVSCFAVSFYALFGQGYLNALFSWDYLRWFGNISYSFYLVHGLSLHFLKVVLGVALTPDTIPGVLFAGLFAVAIGFAIAVGATLFLTVEKPLSLRTQAGRRGAAHAAVAPETLLETANTPAMQCSRDDAG